MPTYFCIRFINFMSINKTLTGFLNLLSPDIFQKIYIIMVEYFQ